MLSTVCQSLYKITGPAWISKLEAQTPSTSDIFNGTLQLMK